MKFLINKRLLFNEDKSTIEVTEDTTKPVMLTGTLCRVLSLLVRNNKELVERRLILSNVWGSYGKGASDSNLNNYISMIRKIFKEFGEPNIIETVPKRGFIFSAFDVSIIDNVRDVDDNNKTESPTFTYVYLRKSQALFFISCLMCFLSIFALTVIIYISMEESEWFIMLS